MRRLPVLAGVVAATVILSAPVVIGARRAPDVAGGRANQQEGCETTRYVPYIFHVPPTIPFISVFDRGLKQAAADFAGPPYCIRTEFLAPDGFDTAKMAQILDVALAQNPDALAIALPDLAALGPGLQRAHDAGIPFVTINTGFEDAFAVGALTHVGSDEHPKAFKHGQRHAEAGDKNVMCVNDNPGTSVLTVRCNAIREAMEAAGGKSFELPASNADLVAMKNAIVASLQQDPTIDGIDGVYSGDYQVALDAIREAGREGTIHVGVFDYEPGTDTLNSIKNGDVLFASSQSPYLQGYLPIQLLALYLTVSDMPNQGKLTDTGGLIVDSTNVDFFLQLAEQTAG